MKVALIVAPYPLEEFPSPPLGLCYVAAAFDAAGGEVRIFDYLVRQYTPEKLYSELNEFKPDIVGINSVTLNFNQAASILQTAKQFFPDVITIMGGPHVSFDFQDGLVQYPEIDIMVIGEGEKTIQALLPAIRDRKSLHHIKGIAFMENDEVFFTGRSDFIKDLDALPLPARHLLPLSRYQALDFPVSIITSRGCPNQCIFCQGRRMVGNKVRYRSIPRIVDEIEQFMDYGFTRFNIADDFFTFNTKRVNAFCNEMKSRNLKCHWSAFARADSVDKNLLETMLDAGCTSVLFGIESGNQEILNRIRKRITLDKIEKAVADCKDVGMDVFGSLIVGLPGETLETLQETHQFVKALDINYGYHFLAPFPGTTVKDEIHEYDLEILTSDWSKFDANHAIVRTSHLSAQEIEEFVYKNYTATVEEDEEGISRRFNEGCPTDADFLYYLGQQKNQIIFQLLSEDLIEKHCSFPANHPYYDEVQQLVYKVAELCQKDVGIAKLIIREIVQSSYLKVRIENDRNIWFWTHNNHVDHFKTTDDEAYVLFDNLNQLTQLKRQSQHR